MYASMYCWEGRESLHDKSKVYNDAADMDNCIDEEKTVISEHDITAPCPHLLSTISPYQKFPGVF